MKHRKLFPDSPTEPNQTTGCPSFCDPACPYNCSPDYYSLPPPPPPPFADGAPSGNRLISPYAVIIVSVLAGLFLLVSYYVIIAKCYASWCRSRNNRQQQDPSDGFDEEFLDGNQVDHPIWYIATLGLQQSVINSIAACRYKKREGLIEGTECSVCLNEFQEDEILRLLPKCNHAFHISCIDTWLRSHINCPLCRARIVLDIVTTPPPASMIQGSDGMDRNVDIRRENSGNRGGEMRNEVEERNRDLCENRERTEEAGELTESKDGVHSNQNGKMIASDQVLDNENQMVRRSVSLDSSSAAALRFGLGDLVPPESAGSSGNQKEDAEKSYSGIIANPDDDKEYRDLGHSSIPQCLHMSPVPMKRSFSCSGRFFSGKRSRSLNEILPNL